MDRQTDLVAPAHAWPSLRRAWLGCVVLAGLAVACGAPPPSETPNFRVDKPTNEPSSPPQEDVPRAGRAAIEVGTVTCRTDEWTRYVPDAGTSWPDLEITWSRRCDSLDERVLSPKALDELAADLTNPDRGRNVYGLRNSAFGMLIDFFHRSGASEPLFGSESFRRNGVNFQMNSAMNRTEGDSASRGHFDLFLTHPKDGGRCVGTVGIPRGTANQVADEGELEFRANSVRMCMGDKASPNWHESGGGRFATICHEMQHSLESSMRRSGKRVIDGWADEWTSKTAEYILDIPPPVDDFDYQTSYGATHYRRGDPFAPVGDVRGVWLYPNWFLWGGYLIDNFRNGTPSDYTDDLVFRLLTDDHQDGKSYVDFWGLARSLEHADYDQLPWLKVSGGVGLSVGDERIKRIFADAGTAIFANAPHVAHGQYAFREGFRPTDHVSIFRSWIKGGNAQTIPPLHRISKPGLVVAEEPYTQDDGTSFHTALYPWSHDYLLFVADGLHEGAKRDLTVKVMPDTSGALGPGEGYRLDLRAHLVTYDVADADSLWYRGGNVIGIEELDVKRDVSGTAVIDASVADFGGRVRSAALVLTMCEYEPMQRPAYRGRVFVDKGKLPRWAYRYSYELR